MPSRGKKLTLLAATFTVVVLGVATWFAWPRLVVWYQFWQVFESLGKNAQGCREYKHRQTGIVMVLVPGGAFWMGSSEEEDRPTYDSLANGEFVEFRHKVTVSSFLLARCEITQGQWHSVMGPPPSHFQSAELPVDTVSWDDCQEFCRKTGLQLPTEAQWEYACRAGEPGPSPGTDRLGEIAWFKGNSYERSHPVGRKTSNGFGLHDMLGNVFEWCEDAFDSDFYRKFLVGGTDPICVSDSKSRTFRGGAYFSEARDCHPAQRGWTERFDNGDAVNFPRGFFGFRAAFYPLP